MTRARATVPTMKTLLSNGVEVHCIDQGTGSPVILLHGGMGDVGSWAHQVCTLSTNHRVIAYSRRHSSPNCNAAPEGTHCVDHDVEDLLALQHALGTGPAHLIGTSYGALVALALAVRHSDAVLSLVLAEPPLHRWACATPSGRCLYESFMAQVWRPAAEAFAHGSERRAMQLLVDGIWGRPVFDEWLPERIDAAMRNAAAMKALTRARHPFGDIDRAAVARLTVPTLLVQGEHASALHRCVMDELARVMHGAQRACIASAGHGAASECPAQFDAAVVRFLGALQTTATGVPT